MTKSTDLRPSKPSAAKLDIFGPALLLEGEDEAGYNRFLAEVSGAVKPADIFEEFWVRDVVDLTWEIFRYRRLKAELINSSRSTGVQRLLGSLGNFPASDTAQGWAAGDPTATKEVSEQLESAGWDMDTVLAQTLAAKLDEVERIDSLIRSAELRRNAVLHEVERHRASLAPLLRKASEAIQDVEYEEITDRKAGVKDAA